jgi:hypothetical protein
VSKFKNKNKKKPAPVIKRRGPVFNYTSVCCEAPAKKPPVERSIEDITNGEFSQCHLGKWHCTKCQNGCKVKRSRVKELNGSGDTESSGTNS